MNILFIEDDMEIMRLAGERFAGNKFIYANTLFYANYCLKHDPGADSFGAVILDLNMPANGLPSDLQDKEGQPGWVFYKNILINYPHLYNRTIFLTGYSVKLKEYIGDEEHDALRIVRKNSGNPTKDLLNHLRDIESTGV